MTDLDPHLDLEILRDLAASPAAIWQCWKDPALFCKWFTPKPVKTLNAQIEMTSGGRFNNTMQMPDDTKIENKGCILMAIPERRIIFTDTLSHGFRPQPKGFMTADITMMASPNGCRYYVRVMHSSAKDREKHFDMGFVEGWNQTITQLEETAKSLDK